MAAKSKRGGLGKGLDAIFIDNEPEESNSSITLKISEIEPNKSQPRKEFDENALAELADSIAQHGVLQPLLVRPIADGGYQIVAGERRWRASRMAGLTEVPVVIRELTDSETMELALIENLQREDLSPVEEAMGYKQLMEDYGFSQEQVSKTVGKSRPSVANALRLLNLPEAVRKGIHIADYTADCVTLGMAVQIGQGQNLNVTEGLIADIAGHAEGHIIVDLAHNPLGRSCYQCANSHLQEFHRQLRKIDSSSINDQIDTLAHQNRNVQ